MCQLGYNFIVEDITLLWEYTRELEQTVHNAIVEEQTLPIHKGIYGMDLAPANISLSTAEMYLVRPQKAQTNRKIALTTGDAHKGRVSSRRQ